jgi:hypothetical protein
MGQAQAWRNPLSANDLCKYLILSNLGNKKAPRFRVGLCLRKPLSLSDLRGNFVGFLPPAQVPLGKVLV